MEEKGGTIKFGVFLETKNPVEKIRTPKIRKILPGNLLVFRRRKTKYSVATEMQ